jgi:hypothetical protein
MCSALRFSHRREVMARMRFLKNGAIGLTEPSGRSRLAHGKEQLRSLAAEAGLSVAGARALSRLGQPVVPRTDATTIRELRRLGGLLKKVHLDSRGAYSEQTAAALSELRLSDRRAV